MDTGRMSRLGCVAICVALMVAGAFAGHASADDSAPAPGGIVIKPTGRRVRVINVVPGAQARVAPAAEVRVTPAQPATTRVSPPAAVSTPGGYEFSERSVRLPGGYDPVETRYGPGPLINCPAPPPSAFGGYCGYSYSSADCGPGFGYSSLGYGRGFGFGSTYGLGYGLGHRSYGGYGSYGVSPGYGLGRSFGGSYRVPARGR